MAQNTNVSYLFFIVFHSFLYVIVDTEGLGHALNDGVPDCREWRTSRNIAASSVTANKRSVFFIYLVMVLNRIVFEL